MVGATPTHKLAACPTEVTLNPFQKNLRLFKRANLRIKTIKTEQPGLLKEVTHAKGFIDEKQGTPQFAKRSSLLSISGSKVKMLNKPD